MTTGKHPLSASLAPQRSTLAVERDGSKVMLTINCDDEYAAMELYDRAVAMAKEGRLRLEISLDPAPDNAKGRPRRDP